MFAFDYTGSVLFDLLGSALAQFTRSALAQLTSFTPICFQLHKLRGLQYLKIHSRSTPLGPPLSILLVVRSAPLDHLPLRIHWVPVQYSFGRLLSTAWPPTRHSSIACLALIRSVAQHIGSMLVRHMSSAPVRLMGSPPA